MAALALLSKHIRVTGIVQGVGFRPFVWRLAQQLNLSGWVRNDAQGVEILAQGSQPGLAELLQRLSTDAPPLARVDKVQAQDLAAEPFSVFSIIASQSGQAATAIGPDVAVCADCLAELFDPTHRRYRHAFITCTHCGPRFTVTRALPYDRPPTSMAAFPLCPACRGQHAQPRVLEPRGQPQQDQGAHPTHRVLLNGGALLPACPASCPASCLWGAVIMLFPGSSWHVGSGMCAAVL